MMYGKKAGKMEKKMPMKAAAKKAAMKKTAAKKKMK